MELRGSTVLLLGGSGLVGMAVARRLLSQQPARVIVTGLTRDEAESAARELGAEAGPGTAIEAAWGNIFLPADLATRPRAAVLDDAAARQRLVDELLGPTAGPALEQNLLFSWLVTYRPDAVVDCINTATALAYQDVFHSAGSLVEAAHRGTLTPAAVERHLLTLALPQLIRHMQILTEGVKRAGTKAYVKIGTSGTGGMGLNIPYTHSEERPSRTLLAKSAVAGAQTLLLFLLGRTPGGPAVIEVKPTAAIAWREIAFGPIWRGGHELELVDCHAPIPLDRAFAPGADGWTRTGTPLRNVFINVGENGVFAKDEFETVSSLRQMELVTPEEIADVVFFELVGRPTGKDVVAAIDGASFGPTYRAGYLRAVAIDALRGLEESHGVRSIAFEMLGPPRLTKLLYEGYILSRLFPSVRALGEGDPEMIARAAHALVVDQDVTLRRQILSVGLPVLLPDGASVLRGEVVVVPPDGKGADIAPRGWVDLRPSNFALWVRRARAITREPTEAGTGSGADWTAIRADAPIRPSRMAVWIFEHEEGGFRIMR